MQRGGALVTASVGVGHAIEGIVFGAERDLEKALNVRGITSEERAKLVSPAQESFSSKYQKALWQLKLADDAGNKEEIDRIEKDILNRFSWAENTYLGAVVRTKDELLQRARDMEQAPKTTSPLRDEKAVLMDRLGLNEEERFLVDTVEICFAWQDDRKERILKAIENVHPVMDRLADAYGIERKDALYLLPHELTDETLRSEAFRKRLARRKDGCFIYATPEATRVFEDEVASELKGLALGSEEHHAPEELTGLVASKGRATGVCRVVTSVEDIDSVKKGEILVASMTRPEYLPAMQRAAAFVTDEGGITSHAAIVSREMGKPCIIGTKNATRILKTGQHVEVDAETGVVRVGVPA